MSIMSAVTSMAITVHAPSYRTNLSQLIRSQAKLASIGRNNEENTHPCGEKEICWTIG